MNKRPIPRHFAEDLAAGWVDPNGPPSRNCIVREGDVVWACSGHRAIVLPFEQEGIAIQGKVAIDPTTRLQIDVTPPNIFQLIPPKTAGVVVEIKSNWVLEELKYVVDSFKPRHTVGILFRLELGPRLRVFHHPTKEQISDDWMRDMVLDLTIEGPESEQPVHIDARYLVQAVEDLGFQKDSKVTIKREERYNVGCPMRIDGPRGHCVIMPINL